MNDEKILVDKVIELTAQLRMLTHPERNYIWNETYERAMIHKERLVYYNELWKMGWSMPGVKLPSDVA